MSHKDAKDMAEIASPVEKTVTGDGTVTNVQYGLHRRLGNRQLQLMAIGCSIGTATFVSIGTGLGSGGPGSLLIAFLFYSTIIGMLNNCAAEMVTYMPVSGGFVRLAGHWVDDAWGFMAGWNFFLYEGLMIPFEITAIDIVLSFWRDDIPTAAICCVAIILYTGLNVVAVNYYGEAEFWLALGKILLIFICYAFTFVTMVGGNPKKDAYGFRHWSNPGAFAEFRSTGNLGRFEGFLACIWNAAFMIVGPEILSMAAGEAKNPRTFIKQAYKTIYWRFAFFFIGSALAVGIVIGYDDPQLVAVLSGTVSGTASASPYVIAMRNLSIGVLPHIVNALLITSIFSAGNALFYNATRTLYGLALQSRAPRIFMKTTKNGVPLPAIIATIIFPLLSLMSLSKGSNKVLGWLVNLVTAGGIINFIVIGVTYVSFYRACKAQGIDRTTLPYTGWGQPYCGYIATVLQTVIVIVYGYTSWLKWTPDSFFTYYTMLLVAPLTFGFWKIFKKTRWLRPEEVDLVWEAPIIDAYEALSEEHKKTFWREIADLLLFWRKDKKESGQA